MKDESRIIFISKDQKKYKEYKISTPKLVSLLSLFLLLVAVIGKFGADLLINYSHNSKIERLTRTNTVLEARLQEMSQRIESINEQIDFLASLDDELRTVLGLDKITADVRKVGIGGSNFTIDLTDEVTGFDEEFRLGDQLMKLAQLEREVKLSQESYNDLFTTFSKKQDSLTYLPALRPVLKGVVSSGFGIRTHPVLKVRRHHDGLDLSAPRGTPVYASADGVVRYASWNGGYGRMVIIDHKYGFETRYGHLNTFFVRPGQTIKRGEKIGEVGNTGLTTASHLHYEVHLKGKPVNPQYYYFEDKILNEKIVSE